MEVPVQGKQFQICLDIYSPLAIFTSISLSTSHAYICLHILSMPCPYSGSLFFFTHICSTVLPHFPHLPHSQQLKRSRIREQVCSSYNALPVSSQRKVVVPYSLLLHPHCPLLDSPSTSHTCLLCYPLPHSLIC